MSILHPERSYIRTYLLIRTVRVKKKILLIRYETNKCTLTVIKLGPAQREVSDSCKHCLEMDGFDTPYFGMFDSKADTSTTHSLPTR